MSEADQKRKLLADGKVGADTPSAGRKQILLAERDGFTRVRLLTWLRTAGLDGHSATNGIQALNKIRSERPDALLVELGLGGLTSLELIRAARSTPGFGSRPIFVYTSTEELNKATRQKVRLLATRVFEKDSTSEFDLSKFLTATLLTPNQDRESVPVGATEPASSVGAGELVLPVEMGEMLAELDERRRPFARRLRGRARVKHCEDFLIQVCSLASCAEFAGSRNLARQANALAALLKELCLEEAPPSDSVPSIVSRAVEVIRLLSTAPAGRSRNLWRFDAVIIDQAATSREAISEAFREIGFDPIAFEDPAAGRDHLMSKAANVVVVNVVPADPHGLTSAEIREMPLQAATPVIFPSEFSAKVNKGKGRSPDAPQLNANLLLLKELIMKALNEVLSAQASGHQRPEAATQSPAPAANPIAATASEPAMPSIAAPDATAGQMTRELAPTIQATEEVQATEPTAHSAPDEIPFVIFQKAPAPAPGPAVETNYENVEGKKTILFIEDDPFVLKVYTRCLRRGGLHVEVASDGMEALEALPRVRPDIVVLDLLLPKLHGLEVLKFIRADVNLKGTPVLVLSNAYVEDLAVKAQQAGANRGIMKTECTPMKLLEIVWEMLGRSMFVPPQAAVQEPQQPQAPPDESAPQTETAIWVRQADLLNDVPKEVSEIRRACLGYIKSVGAEEKMACLHELYRRVRFLGARAGLCGFEKIAELCNPFEGLLFQILYNQTAATPSTFNTIAQTVDCLDRFSQSQDSKSLETKTKARVLVVDDDAVCNFAMVNALKRASFEVEGVLDPVESLRVLEANSFDMVLLDINMPQLNGFEVCEQLRRMPQYKSVPVVFVTLDSDFQNRARGILAGGNDVLIKPVFALELILKVTMHLLKSGGQDSPEGLAPADALVAAPPVDSLSDARISPDTVEQFSRRSLTPSETAAAWVPAESTESEQLQQSADALAAALLQQLSAGQPASTVEEQTKPEPWQNRAEPVSLQGNSPEVTQGWTEDVQQQETSPAELSSDENQTEATGSPAAFESPLEEQTRGQEVDSRLQALEDECAKHREAAGQYQKERETLVARIYSSETNLHHANTRLERGAQTIAKLQEQLVELTREKAQTAAAAEKAEEEAPPVAGGPDPLVVAAKNAAKDALKSRQKTEEKCDQLERELAEARQAREELQGWLEKEQTSAAESGKRIQELELGLNQSSAEMERQAAERNQAEAELRRQLESINAVAQQREKEQGQAQAQCARLESQLAGMSTTREELERRLNQASAELQKQAKEFGGAKADLSEQLDAAAASVQQREAAQNQAEVRCAGLEKELAGVSQSRDELGRQFTKEQQVAAESAKRINDLQQRLSQKDVEAETRAMERGRAEAQWRHQLEAAAALAQQAEATREKAEVRCAELQQELAELRNSREELATQKQVAAESNKRIQDLEQRLNLSNAESEKRGEEHGRVESELRKQLEAATAAVHQHESTQKQVEGRYADLEKELGDLRKTRDELNGKLTQDQHAAVESNKRIQELEKRRAELEEQAAETGRVDADLRKQLEAAAVSVQQREATQKQTETRCVDLEKELADLRRTREELGGQFAKEQQVAAESSKRVKDLEQQLLQRAADQGKQSAEHGRAESELRKQLEAAAGSAQQREATQKQTETRCADLEKELADLRRTREELGGQFAKEQQVAAESSKRVKDLEQQLLQRAADQGKQSAEHGRAESELRKQLETAAVSAQKREVTQKQAEARCAELEKELADLRRTREELGGQFAKEQQVAAESSKRIQDLEQQLNQRAADNEKQSAEHGRAESEFRKELEAAAVSAQKREATQKQAEAHCADLEKELADLRKTREELGGKFAKEQLVAAESSKRVKDLEQQLNQRAADNEKQSAEHGRAESELRKQLETAAVSAQQREVTQKQAEARCTDLDKELAGLRKSREELGEQFAKEQQVAAESSKRIQDLEQRLKLSDVELQKQGKERSGVEAELRRQLETSNASIQQREASRKQADFRCAELEKELAGLSKTREELKSQVAKEQLAASEKHKRFQELEQRHAKVEAQLEKQAKQHGRAELDLQQKLESAIASARKAEDSQKQARVRSAQLEQELTALDKARQELDGQLAERQKIAAESGGRVKDLEQRLKLAVAELERGKAESENKAKERDHAESVLRLQVETATASVLRTETAQKLSQNRCAQLEQELEGLRKEREGLNSQAAKTQQVVTESGKRAKELEDRLQQSAAELAKRTEEHGRAESELRRQLEVASAGLQQSDTAHKQSQIRCAQLEQELAGLFTGRQELDGRLAKEQQTVAESQKRIQELEQRLIESTSELERRKAELEKRASEHGAVEAELRRQVELANAAVQQGETARNRTEARCAQFEQELAGWRRTQEELDGQVAKGRQALAESTAKVQELEKQIQSVQADRTAHIGELDQRVRQGVSALTRAMADLAKERGERLRSEQNVAALNTRLQELHAECGSALQSKQAAMERLGTVEAQLQQREQAFAKQSANVEQERTARRLAEEQLQSERQLADQLRKDLAFFDEARGVFDRTRQELQSKLEAALTNQQQIDSHLRQETAERQRLAEALDTAQLQVQDQARNRDSFETRMLASTESLQASELKLQQTAAERLRLADAMEGVQRELRHESQTRQTLEAQLKTSTESLRANEAKLQETAGERQRLTETLDGVQNQLQAARRKGESLESRLSSTVESFQANEAKLQESSAERQRLAVALETARLALGDLTQRLELESCNHQSALHLEQVERKRQETNIARMRQASLDSLRAARVVRNGLRQQIREPVESLCQSASSLLESQMAEQQKALAEAVLHQALMVRARLQDPELEQSQSVAGLVAEQGVVASS